ncbi:MFS transporter [Nonomuraea gerenzanensis]|uniref:Integral membrane transport protein n=2 Tax=Nonomuraea gerenzanensis TaxID=93944 RepID=A0A1M4ELG5_9ACTN|nr:MFS transporter [Nonomuraea gerenzanensis]SBO99684.1 Integral membrane transport protein [Nonomuraea gerenzanensis]
MLALGVNAHAGVTLGLFGLPLVMPEILRHFNVSLPVGGLIANAPAIGVMLALVAWGALADRYGERVILGAGVGLAAAMLAATAFAGSTWAVITLLALAGAGGSAAMVGGGRIVLRWFEPAERGVAMGVRQVSFTLGMAVSAFALPPMARAHGLPGVLLLCAGVSLLAAVLAALFMAEPPRPIEAPGTPRAGSPYRQPALWRVHATSALHVVPQVVVTTYGVDCLVTTYGWDDVAAGRLFGVAAIAGAAIRIAAGRWSDHLRLRMRPLLILTLGNLVVLALLVAGTLTTAWLGAAALVLASVTTVSGNGLAYLAAGELAGPGWAGKVLGTHNTVQNTVSLAVTPLAGALIVGAGYWAGFAAGLACAAASLPVIPRRWERSKRS